MTSNRPKQIYFHVGLGKTGTTYLQYALFPKLKGIHYIQRTKWYQGVIDGIKGSNFPSYLVSREFDVQMEEEVSRFAQHFPDAHPIIVFRRHDGWIASQYRRFAKNGIHVDFDGFIDIDHDQGMWKLNELIFMDKIRLLEKTFTHKPLVLFQEDLKRDPYAFFDQIAAFTGSTYEREAVSLSAIHPSYEEKQLKAVRKFSRFLFPAQETRSRKTLLGWLQWRRLQITSYLIMYAALLLPAST